MRGCGVSYLVNMKIFTDTKLIRRMNLYESKNGNVRFIKSSYSSGLLAPTLLDFFGIDLPDNMDGKLLRKVIEMDQPI